jgi:hypothetical protein
LVFLPDLVAAYKKETKTEEQMMEYGGMGPMDFLSIAFLNGAKEKKPFC